VIALCSFKSVLIIHSLLILSTLCELVRRRELAEGAWDCRLGARYVSLQNIYQQQAATDLQCVQAHAHQVCSASSLSADLVSADNLKLFCKNAMNLEVHEYRPLEYEYQPETVESSTLSAALEDEANSGTLYVMLRAAQAYRAERSHWPGSEGLEPEADVPVFKQFVNEVLKELNMNGGVCPVSDDIIHEFCRWGGAEMHAIASVMGGIASQEAIKAVTHQYVPLDNTFIFNGTSGTTSVLKL